MAERKAVTKAIATRYKRVDKAGKAKILDELVRHDRVASRSCAQGAAWCVAATGGSSAGAAPTEVWPESHCGAGVLLGGAGHAGRQKTGPHTG